MISNICLSCGDDLDWPSGDGCANMTAHKNDNKPWENLVTDELVKRLRDWPRQGATKSTNLLGDAADRIEQLTAERDDALECNEQFFVYNQFLKKRVEKAEAEWRRYESAWMTAEGKLADAMEGLEKCQAELDEYSRQEYPLDHSVHERYRQRDYDANPARITLAALKGESHD